MAYPVAVESAAYAPGAAADKSVPDGHQVDDLLLAIVWQDGGGTTIATSTTGWALLGPTQAQENTQRTVVFWKRATSAAEADLDLTGATDDWGVILIVIRGVNWSNPFNAFVRSSVTGINPTSGSLTTTANNCLVIYALGYDGVMRVAPKNPGDLFFLAKVALSQTIGPLVGGYRVQKTAGAVAEVEMMCSIPSEGGSFWTIAIEDDGSGQLPPDCRESFEVLKHHGSFSAQHDGITWEAPSAMAGSPTIDGLALDTTVPSVGLISTNPSNGWNYPIGLSVTTSLGADAWAGGSFELSPVADMSGKLFGVRFGGDTYSSPLGLKGFMVAFQDSAGAWAAFRLSRLSGITASGAYYTYYSILDHEQATPLDSGGGTIDWTDIERIAYCYHRVAGSALARRFVVADAFLFSGTVLFGGSVSSPCTTAILDAAISGWNDSKAASLQGDGQTLCKVPFQLGNGTDQTYVEEAARSLETPRAYAQSLVRRLWQGAADSITYRIKASAADVVRVGGGVAATTVEQPFIIDAASSPSASYDFSGAVFSGWRVEHLASGVTINGASFVACYVINLTGSLSQCAVRGSVAASAVVTASPDEIEDCAFVSGAAGHAIEITSPGSYTFSGNTFSGYGADGTTDAAIYNNSGGAVTLDIAGGGGTPTVRNGAGASTTVNNNVSVTLQEVVVGSSIRVELVSDGSLVEFRVADATTEVFSVAGSVAYRIKVRKASGAPYYRPWLTTITPTGDATITVAQELD